ncbi:hypothetical protein JHK82_033989 [Glycine max]|nr:hypothetical protein JHK87_033920 [Glycine soja]KAG5119569.1 hypothetical protein JHK82_033989 [Glycine max]
MVTAELLEIQDSMSLSLFFLGLNVLVFVLLRTQRPLDWYAMKRFYRLKKCCFGLDPNEKPPTDAIDHEVGRYYQTLNHTCFTQETPFNMVCTWTRELYVMSDCTFSFVVFLPFSKFFFTHHVDPIIGEVECYVEDAFDSMVVQVYDPSPSYAYVCLLEVELAITREDLAQALQDYAHVGEARKWFMI